MQKLNVARNGWSIAQIRNETPGCRQVIHLNNAGCSLPSRDVIDATEKFYRQEVTYGGYECVEKAEHQLRKPYAKLGTLLNCRSDEIAIVPSATVAWQQVVFGMDFQRGDVILTTPNEYGSNFINLMQLQSRKGIDIRVIPEDEEGGLDLKALEQLVEKYKPKLLTLTHVPTSTGSVYEASRVGEIARAYRIPFLLDACQSVGQMKVDVKAVGCDFLSATSRKFLRGPRGIGFLYASERMWEHHEPAFLDVRSAVWESDMSYTLQPHAMRYEQYEINFAAKAGFGVAVESCMELGVDWIEHRVGYLAEYARSRLAAMPRIRVHDHCPRLCAIVSFTKEGMTATEISRVLRERGINVSVSRRPSTRLKFEAMGLQEVVRASVHYYNTEEEIDAFLDAVDSV